jgi:hypothetical protein
MIRRRAAQTAISKCLGLALGAGIAAAQARAASGACEHVVLYHCCEDSVGNPTGDEWRLFDPKRDHERMLLRGPISAMRWDTAFRNLEFEARDTLYRLEWREASTARVLIPLPDIPNRCTAWWNPDSSAWQALAMYGAWNGAPLRHLSYQDSVRAELWQRSRRSGRWMLLRSVIIAPDELGPPGCELWTEWLIEGARREPRVTLEDLERDVGAWPEGGVLAAPNGEAPVEDGAERGWQFAPSAPGSDVGFAYRTVTAAPERDFPTEPLYHVNRRTGASRRVWGRPRSEEILGMALQIRCERLLLTPGFDLTRLVSGRTGDTLRLLPTRKAVWIPRPGP